MLAGLGVAATAGIAVWYVVIPYPWTLATRNPERTALIEQRLREADAAGASLELRHEWRRLGDISPDLVRAVLVAEDYRFRQHRGIDWVSLAEEVGWSGDGQFSWWSPSDLRALARAVAYTWSNRHEIRGRSTITQQLAKNLYFGTDRTFLRKALELVVAKRLERRLDKDRILELYLNVVEWGPGIFGAEAASRAYFDRSASSLSLDQAAALAGTLPHPLASNPARSPGRMLWRKELILERLDPTGGMSTEPMPVSEPDMDLVLSGPGMGPIGIPALPGSDSLTVRSDTLPGADTLPLPGPHTLPGSDTLSRSDTLLRSPGAA